MQRGKNRYIRLPLLCLTPQTEGFPWDDLRITLPVCEWVHGQGTKQRRNIAENFNRLSKVHERYRQTTDKQTDGRAMIYSERERECEFTLAKKTEIAAVVFTFRYMHAYFRRLR